MLRTCRDERSEVFTVVPDQAQTDLAKARSLTSPSPIAQGLNARAEDGCSVAFVNQIAGDK